ncbi:hypothetical protein LOTGIDRAFT_163823 [Lottia gigantea]|uniref:Uncharacterized protein n=1 Tax=Lottia gigantea TaxID=225164 RepID=V4A1S2_LOTGI|nr:hypothetical protein LOTGIDRAFT_163823 [Lottia gigantea]ESO90627.1 hypothetical protein LOTGIDRAFT_163823 [Lottia gigantea]
MNLADFSSIFCLVTYLKLCETYQGIIPIVVLQVSFYFISPVRYRPVVLQVSFYFISPVRYRPVVLPVSFYFISPVRYRPVVLQSSKVQTGSSAGIILFHQSSKVQTSSSSGGIFDRDDHTSQKAFEYAIKKHKSRFKDPFFEFNVTGTIDKININDNFQLASAIKVQVEVRKILIL